MLYEDPDTHNARDMFFMRGNLEYEPVGLISGQPMEPDPNSYYETIQTIDSATAIFIPVLTSMFVINSLYNGIKLQTEYDLFKAVSDEISQGGDRWCTINKVRLSDELVETPVFSLKAHEQARLMFEEPIPSGVNLAVCKGYFIIIKSLMPGQYDLDFGCLSNVGVYYSHSIYHITVRS